MLFDLHGSVLIGCFQRRDGRASVVAVDLAKLGSYCSLPIGLIIQV